MGAFYVIVAVLGGVWILREAGRMNPKQARKFGAKVLGYALLLVGALFSLHGNFAFGVPVIGIGAGLLGYGNFSFAPQPKPRTASQQPQSAMDRAEAYDVLGLEPGASRDEINAAFKRLQRANHPDAGGSTYL